MVRLQIDLHTFHGIHRTKPPEKPTAAAVFLFFSATPSNRTLHLLSTWPGTAPRRLTGTGAPRFPEGFLGTCSTAHLRITRQKQPATVGTPSESCSCRSFLLLRVQSYTVPSNAKLNHVGHKSKELERTRRVWSAKSTRRQRALFTQLRIIVRSETTSASHGSSVLW